MLRQLSYDLDTNLLFRPAILLVALLLAGVLLPSAELALSARLPGVALLSDLLAPNAATSQLVLATVAGAMMSVVSVVYSILLVALSLASMQFSTRILAGFMRDPLSRSVLGLFVGTFAYCLALLTRIHDGPGGVPGLSVAGAMLLAFTALGALVLYIHHIVRSIQANVLIDRIARATEGVLDAAFPQGAAPAPAFTATSLPVTVPSDRSGYLQLIDAEGLLRAAPGANLQMLRGNGAFVAEGVALMRADRPVDAARLLACVDIGPERTMQDDAEFGLRQIVDIALKALSPAVNDPSTAATCVDHLGRLLIRVANRPMGAQVHQAGGGALLIPCPRFEDLLDLAVEQIRQYGKGDMATALRLMRVLGELWHTVPEGDRRDRIRMHAERVREAAQANFCAADNVELDRRFAALC